MASRAAVDPFLIEVKFHKREDGGLRAECDALPGFYLSHSDPELVVADVAPALSVILGAMYGGTFRVEPLREIQREIDGSEIPAAHICDAQRYVGLANTS